MRKTVRRHGKHVRKIEVALKGSRTQQQIKNRLYYEQRQYKWYLYPNNTANRKQHFVSNLCGDFLVNDERPVEIVDVKDDDDRPERIKHSETL